MDLSKIMQMAEQMRDQMEQAQKEAVNVTADGEAGGGMVKVTMNGKHELKKIKIEPSLLDKNEVEVLEDLIVAAMNDATKKISENMSTELGSLSSGMGLPPGMKLPF